MEEKKLLIVGIDPGTTIGFAVLDIEGNLLHLDSSKHLSLDSLISVTIGLGKAVLVGTDKSKVPNLVKTFATKLGAEAVCPGEDLKVDEKRKMTGSFETGDDHQSDALASALFAYKEIKPLLSKIDIFVRDNKKHGIKDRIKEIVITKKMSIKGALSMIEKKDEESTIMKKVVEDDILSQKDFLKLYVKLKKCQKELELVKSYNNNLKSRISFLEGNRAEKEIRRDSSKVVDFREKRARFLEGILKSKDKEIGKLKFLLRGFNNILSRINDFYVLKKLDTLGIAEFNFKNRVLQIRKNDILLVDDPNAASLKVVGLLKEKVFIIVHNKPISKKLEMEVPFLFIDAANLRIEDDKYFGFVEKRHFEAEKDRAGWAMKMVEEYQNEKKQLIYR